MDSSHSDGSGTGLRPVNVASQLMKKSCFGRGSMVPFGAPKGAQLENGRLADVAPTMLALMGIEKPRLMTGHSLLKGGGA